MHVLCIRTGFTDGSIHATERGQKSCNLGCSCSRSADCGPIDLYVSIEASKTYMSSLTKKAGQFTFTELKRLPYIYYQALLEVCGNGHQWGIAHQW